LSPGNFDDPLTASLEESTPYRGSYEALSYTWGPPGAEQVIDVQGHQLQIRRNLATALRYLRYPDRSRRLWADALSISQTDPQEKALQVENIGRIFKEASSTLAWVGVPDPRSELYIREINRKRSEGRAFLKAVFKMKRHVRSYEARWGLWSADISNFLEREYWERTWIIQELIVSRNVKMVCGRQTTDWSEFIASLPPEASALSTLASLRDDYQQWEYLGKTKSLLATCMQFSYYKCFDPRDKVYALLSLLPTDNALRPDYTKATEQLFLDVLAEDLPFIEDGIRARKEYLDNVPPYNTVDDVYGLVQDFAESLGLAEGFHDTAYIAKLFPMDISPRHYSRQKQELVSELLRRVLNAPTPNDVDTESQGSVDKDDMPENESSSGEDVSSLDGAGIRGWLSAATGREP
jgi:Heterokaryon incompatibility protein (HET)